MVLGQSFNGAGDTWTPTIINLFVFWLWEIPLAYVLGVVMGFGPRGVFYSMTIAFSTLAIVSASYFAGEDGRRELCNLVKPTFERFMSGPNMNGNTDEFNRG